MSQFIALLQKELAFWFWRPGVHLFALLFALFGVLTMLSSAGDLEFIRFGGMGGLIKADAPNQLIVVSMVFSLFMTMNFAAAAGGAATRDISNGMHPLVYSTSVPRMTFLSTRYLGALAVSTYLVAAVPVGLFLGRLLPFLEDERIGAFAPLTTVVGVMAWIGPNVIGVTALFFAIGALTRRMFPIYIGGIFLFVAYLGSGAFLRDLDNRTLGVMLDPFGMSAINEVTRYWTPVEKNTLLPLPVGVALANRVLWTVLGLGTLGFAFAVTKLDQNGWQPLARFRRAPVPEGAESFEGPVVVPPSSRSFEFGGRVTQLVALTRQALRDVIGHRYFWAFVGAALLFELLNSQAIGSMYGTDTWPVTYQVLEIFEGTLGLFMLIILTFYAGDLVWTERDLGSAQLLDTTPIPSGLPMFAKFVALTSVVLGLHSTILVLGPLVQLAQGHTQLDLSLYIQALYALSMLDWIPYIALALMVHAVCNNRLVGHSVLVGYWGLTIFRSQLGFEHNLFWFGSDPGRMFSDMNSWGFSLGPFLIYKAYWMATALVLIAVARLAWVRGTDTAWRTRLSEARRRLDLPMRAMLGAGMVTSGGLALYIAVQTNLVHGYETTVDRNRASAYFEKTYKSEWEGAPHPIITRVDTEVDLYPGSGRAEVRGTLKMVNPHDVPIGRMLVAFPEEDHVVSVSFTSNYTETMDEEVDLRMWVLDPPLAPGARATLEFVVDYHQVGMANSGFETSVVPNGTFLHAYEVFPAFGYEAGAELSDPADRRKYDLPERARMLDLDDPKARLSNYLTDDAHRVLARTRVSTVAGQIPLAPGNIVSEGEGEGRVWRVFETDEPIMYFLAFLSADWEVQRSEEGPVPVEVYYSAEHHYNVDRMLEGMVDALTMFERDFGPFQHDVLRIVEFPRYASYAQSFPTLVPFSEAIGFIARLTDPDEDIDYPFYVTAHEVAHQWWAHQICAGNGQGATLLSESLAQYSALKVMEAEYGPEEIDRFLEYESDRYFGARGSERDKELPLMRVENQQYIHYQKGGIVLYALSERVGRERFDAAIRSFLDQWRFEGPPYPIARDFVDHLKAELPEHLEAISEGLERIVLYDLRLENAKAEREGTGWVLTLDVVAKKLEADGEGRENELAFSDVVGVSVTDQDGAIVDQAVQITGSGEVRVVFGALAAPPESVRLDRRALFLERERDDNKVTVELSGA